MIYIYISYILCIYMCHPALLQCGPPSYKLVNKPNRSCYGRCRCGALWWGHGVAAVIVLIVWDNNTDLNAIKDALYIYLYIYIHIKNHIYIYIHISNVLLVCSFLNNITLINDILILYSSIDDSNGKNGYHEQQQQQHDCYVIWIPLICRRWIPHFQICPNIQQLVGGFKHFFSIIYMG